VQDNLKALDGNAAMAAHLLNELSLASKQLALAEAADATAYSPMTTMVASV
jgi:hypothetical protein